MPLRYFLAPYVTGTRKDERSCAIELFVSPIVADGGHVAVAEIDGNQAIALVRASTPLLNEIDATFASVANPSLVWTPTYRTFQRNEDGTISLHPTRTHASKTLEDLRAEVLNDGQARAVANLVDGYITRANQNEVVTLPPGFSRAQQNVILFLAARAGYGLNRIKPGTFPTTGVLDDFNRANAQTLGSNWAGNTIAIYSGTATDQAIVSNAVGVATDASAVALHYTATTYGPDSEAYVTLSTVTTGDHMHVYARIAQPGTSTFDGYSARYSDPDLNWRLNRIDNGAFTTLATFAQGVVAGDKLGIEIIGSGLAMYRYTSGAWQQQTTATDTTYSAAGLIGLYCPGTAGAYALDDFGGGTVAAGVSYTRLERGIRGIERGLYMGGR